jgi:flagellar basal-body rod protein FlgF
MENSLYVGLSSQVALEAKMALVSNNIANMNTPGYRGQNIVFEEYLSSQRRMKEDVSLVYDYGQFQNADAGPIKQTGNPLDVALVGPGFMGIQTPEGVQYTRSGNFILNELGELVTPRGLRVADQGGGTITIPDDAKWVSIDQKGVVSTDQGEIAAIMMAEFENYQLVEPQGNGLYATEQPAQPAAGTKMLQGRIEGSNVQSVVEMTRMIEVTREYQSMQRMVQSEHERLRTAIQRMLKTS